MCICDIVCLCNISDSPPLSIDAATVEPSTGGACLLGKTRPPHPLTATDDKLNLFNIYGEYKSYAYTLSPKDVGILAGKPRNRQYETLKRLHNEVLSNFDCSYIINIEVYPSDDNYLHCHGIIRFRNHSQKELFKKTLKDKITLFKKGTYSNLIDCEFINDFKAWSDYIMKAQEYILSLGYYPFIKIDYSFHIPLNEAPSAICLPVASKKRLTKKSNLEAQLIKAQLKVNNLLSQISNL